MKAFDNNYELSEEELDAFDTIQPSRLNKFITLAVFLPTATAAGLSSIHVVKPNISAPHQLSWPNRPTSAAEVDTSLVKHAQYYCEQILPLDKGKRADLINKIVTIGNTKGVPTEIAKASAMEGCHRAHDLEKDTIEIAAQLSRAYATHLARISENGDVSLGQTSQDNGLGLEE